MTTEERLENLERELARAKRHNRWLAAIAGLVVVGLVLAWAWDKITSTAQPQEGAKPAKPAQVIRATAFVLVDDEGRERGKLEMLKDQPQLVLSDANGSPRAMLVASRGCPAVVLYDAPESNYSVMLSSGGLCLRDDKGRLRAGLRVSGDQASLELNDANGKPPSVERVLDYLEAKAVPFWHERGKRGVWLGVQEDGPVMLMNDENGMCRAELAANKEGARLNLSDVKGKPRAGLSADQDGPRLLLSDENGKTRVGLAAVTGGTVLGLSDENGKPRAALSLEEDGPMLGLCDKNGNMRARLQETPAGASLALCDENNEYRAGLYGSKHGPLLSLADVNKQACAMLMMSPYGTSLNLSDKNATRVSLKLNKDGPRLDFKDVEGKTVKSLP